MAEESKTTKLRRARAMALLAKAEHPSTPLPEALTAARGARAAIETMRRIGDGTYEALERLERRSALIDFHLAARGMIEAFSRMSAAFGPVLDAWSEATRPKRD